jgi:2,3-bisphosphoglycerate-independent phosphoglycerate mutase
VEHPEEPAAPRQNVKRVLVVLSGAFDPPGDGTPLCDAEKPALDRMARDGRAGIVDLGARSPWDGFTALVGLGDAAPSLGAAEAFGAGVEVASGEVAYRADFVTVADGVVRDPFGGKVKDPEAASLNEAVLAAAPGARIVRAGGHRNVVLLRGPEQFCPSPWEMVGQKPASGLPGEGPLREFYDAAAKALAAHDVNAVRIDLGENPANALWLHGGGAAAMPGRGAGRGVLVGRGAATAGLARLLGWERVLVEGDDEVLAAAALAAMAASDLVVVRTESVIDAAASGGREAKRDALSLADARLVAPLLAAGEERDAFVMAVAADSVLAAETHALARRPVPFVVVGAGGGAASPAFTERVCDAGGFRLASGAELFALLR